MKVDLNINDGFEWHQTRNVWAKGFLFDSNNNLYEKEKILDYFVDIKNKKTFEEKLNNANGFFSVVVKTSNCIFAAVDCVRSHPLFYNLKSQWLGDNPDNLSNTNRLQTNKIAHDEFKFTGYVTGKNTVYDDIMQIRAGEYISINLSGDIERSYYYQYIHKDFSLSPYDKALQELDNKVTIAIQRLIIFANGRQLIIPLSGGFDSRLIVLKLNALGYKNVLCFSYGRENNKESLISKKVASHLEFKWTFINYDPIIKALHDGKSIKNYYTFAHRGVSLPHIQDFLAVHQLKENSDIQKDAIFVPGHSGDFLAGSHLSQLELNNDELNDEQIAQQILQKHYVFFKLNQKKKKVFLNKIKKTIIERPKNGDSSSQIDFWNLSERQAKFIVNSCRVYEFFDFQWYCPLWDRELMEYFRKMTKSFRKNRSLYNNYIDQLEPKLKESVELNKNFDFRSHIKELLKSVENIPGLMRLTNTIIQLYNIWKMYQIDVYCLNKLSSFIFFMFFCFKHGVFSFNGLVYLKFRKSSNSHI